MSGGREDPAVTAQLEAEKQREVVELSWSADGQAAFVAALGALHNLPKDSTADTGKFRYDYVSLPALLEHVKPVLAAYGLAIYQPAVSELVDSIPLVGVETIVMHRSGWLLDCGRLVLPAGPTAQTAGSAVTYARRYALCSVLGIAGDEDDDGTAASLTGRGGPQGTADPFPSRAAEPPQAGSGAASPASEPVTTPTLPVGEGPADWRVIAQRLTRLLKSNVTQADAKLKVVEVLRARDVRLAGGVLIKDPSDVTADLAFYAVDEIAAKLKGGNA